MTSAVSLALAAVLAAAPATAPPVEGEPEAAPVVEAEPPAAAPAEGGGVVVEPATLGGQASEEGGPVLQSSLERALASTPVRFADPGCDAACVDALVEETGAKLRLRVSLTEQNRDYTATIEWLDARGKELARGEATCEICTVDEAAKAAAAEAAKLMPTDERTVLAITTDPAGARVHVDGKAMGGTPIELALDAGPHEIGIELPGYRYEHREVDVGEGKRTELAIDLVKAPVERKRSKLDPRKAKIAGWTTLAVGVAALIGGITLIAFDEKPVKNDCSGPNVDAFGNCRERWNTLGGGVAMTVVGVLAAGTGVGLLVVSRPRAQVRANIGPGRAGLAIRF